MNFSVFINEITARVQAIVGEDASVEIQVIRKNNNVLLHGMSIMHKRYNVSPTIYLEGFYEMLQDGMDMDSVVSRLLSIYVKGLPKNKVDMEFFMDFEQVKERIVYRLINREKNAELLKDIPHVDFLDLTICFYYSYEHFELGEGMILIHNSHMEMWHTNHQELMHLAERNTPRLLPVQLESMDQAMVGILNEEQLEEFRKLQKETNRYMYVLTNNRKNQGAAVILYPGVLAETARKLGGGFYILPSSIHEVILLVDREQSHGEELHEMIADINQSQVQEEEVLSDYAYWYDAETGKVTEIR